MVNSRSCGQIHTQLWVISDARCTTVGSLSKGRKKRGGEARVYMSCAGGIVVMGSRELISLQEIVGHAVITSWITFCTHSSLWPSRW